MNKAILQIELRKVLPWYAPLLLVTLGYVLFNPTPLVKENFMAAFLSFIQGYLVVWVIFRDKLSVESFLFSRGITRGKLFWHRWGLAVGLNLLTILIAATVISAGLRCLIFHNGPWHPMVKWYELNILWPLGLGSTLGVSLLLFLQMRTRFQYTNRKVSAKQKTLSYLTSTAGKLAVVIVMMPAFLHQGDLPSVPVTFLLLAYLYAAGLFLLATGTARSCFLKMEIHA